MGDEQRESLDWADNPTYGIGPRERPVPPMPIRVDEWLGPVSREGCCPFATVWIDTTAMLAGLGFRACTPEERGVQVMWVLKAAMNGQIEALERLPYVDRVDKGRAVGERTPIPKAIRSEVLGAGECRACGSTGNLTVDHVIPVARGGSDRRHNLQCLCQPCNSSKGMQTMEEWQSDG